MKFECKFNKMQGEKMKKNPTLGFIGTGMMTSAAVIGFCERSKTYYPIILANRTIEKAIALKEKYPEKIEIANSFQECVDKSDWVIIAVLPNSAKEVLESIKFRENHKIISFIFSMGKEEIEPLLNCKVEAIVHMVPGTFVSVTSGPIVQRPPHPEAEEIFSNIGTPVAVEEKSEEEVLISLTSTFAPIFSVQDTYITWCKEQGLNEKAAVSYITSLFKALSEETLEMDADGIHHLATVNTPGGINMQAVSKITEEKGFEAFKMALDDILKRIRG